MARLQLLFQALNFRIVISSQISNVPGMFFSQILPNPVWGNGKQGMKLQRLSRGPCGRIGLSPLYVGFFEGIYETLLPKQKLPHL